MDDVDKIVQGLSANLLLVQNQYNCKCTTLLKLRACIMVIMVMLSLAQADKRKTMFTCPKFLFASGKILGDTH